MSHYYRPLTSKALLPVLLLVLFLLHSHPVCYKSQFDGWSPRRLFCIASFLRALNCLQLLRPETCYSNVRSLIACFYRPENKKYISVLSFLLPFSTRWWFHWLLQISHQGGFMFVVLYIIKKVTAPDWPDICDFYCCYVCYFITFPF